MWFVFLMAGFLVSLSVILLVDYVLFVRRDRRAEREEMYLALQYYRYYGEWPTASDLRDWIEGR